MMHIGIIGASSQVGSSLAYYLMKYPDIRLTCFIRSSYSEIFFDLLNIPYIKIDLGDPISLKAQLINFDAIIDCTFPTGQLYSIKKTAFSSIQNLLSCMPSNATYFYMSSIMAYGMPPDKYLKNHIISRSWYASVKRAAENAAVKNGKKYSVKVYNFRLGQVHGILQSPNATFREKLSKNNFVNIDGEPQELTNTIFVHSIALAIRKCMDGLCRPGTYAMVSNPQWTLKELYGYYLTYYCLSTELIYSPREAYKQSWSILKNPFDMVKRYRYLFEIYFVSKFPLASLKIKGRYRKNEVARALHEKEAKDNYVQTNLLGSAGRQMFPLDPSPVELIKGLERSFENSYNELLKNRRS